MLSKKERANYEEGIRLIVQAVGALPADMRHALLDLLIQIEEDQIAVDEGKTVLGESKAIKRHRQRSLKRSA